MFEGKRVYDETDPFGTRVYVDLIDGGEDGSGVVVTTQAEDYTGQVLLSIDELIEISGAVVVCLLDSTP